LLIVLGAAWLLFHGATLKAAPGDLTVGVFHQQGPYSHFDSEGKAHGLLVDTLAPLRSDNQDFRYRHIPHGRIAHELAKGGVDFALFLVMAGEMVQPEIESIVITQQPLFTVPLYLYSDQNLPKRAQLPEHFSAIADLDGLKVGLYRANVSKNYIGLSSSANVVFFNRYESAVKSLMSYRIDLLGIDPLSAAHWQQRFGMTWKQRYFFGNIDVHLAFSGVAMGARAYELCESYWQLLKSYSDRGFFNHLSERPNGTEYLTYFSEFDQKDGPYCHSL
tara:strand:+ start:18475 stop:19302 length:828 start_codon:yes stop_codon:yes gene_type:complete